MVSLEPIFDLFRDRKLIKPHKKATLKWCDSGPVPLGQSGADARHQRSGLVPLGQSGADAQHQRSGLVPLGQSGADARHQRSGPPYLVVEYDGELVSSGFRARITVHPDTWYRIKIKSELSQGDMAFVYCDSIRPNQRLVERAHLITPKLGDHVVDFRALSSEIYLGLLFYNSHQDYRLKVMELSLWPTDGPTTTPETDSEVLRALQIAKTELVRRRQMDEELKTIIQRNGAILSDMIREEGQEDRENREDREDGRVEKGHEEVSEEIEISPVAAPAPAPAPVAAVAVAVDAKPTVKPVSEVELPNPQPIIERIEQLIDNHIPQEEENLERGAADIVRRKQVEEGGTQYLQFILEQTSTIKYNHGLQRWEGRFVPLPNFPDDRVIAESKEKCKILLQELLKQKMARAL